MNAYVAAPDTVRFPLALEDYALATSHGLDIRPMVGHSIEEFCRVAPDAIAILVWQGQFGTELFDALPSLRALARCGAGYDNIDVVEAHNRGITVTYTPGLFDGAVADHVIAMIYALTRQLISSDRAVRGGGWPSMIELAPIRSIGSLTLGLVGVGGIGSEVVRRATALGMSVLAFDPLLADPPRHVVLVSTLDELLRRSDVVSLHAPLTAETRGLIGAAALAAMKPTAYLINTGRGGLVDGEALSRALTNGLIAGAALDVFDPEPIPPDHPILRAPSTLLTPHSAALEADAVAAVRRQAISDAIAVIEGRAPAFPVAMERRPT